MSYCLKLIILIARMSRTIKITTDKSHTTINKTKEITINPNLEVEEMEILDKSKIEF